MKRIIDKITYNTETATMVATHEPCDNKTKALYIHECLYINPKGAWFVVGEGGVRTRYARHGDGDSIFGGEGLYPLTADEARVWLEEREEIEGFEHWFGEQQETEASEATYLLRLPAHLKARAVVASATAGKSLARWIVEAIDVRLADG